MQKTDANIKIGADATAVTKTLKGIRQDTDTMANSVSARLARIGTAVTTSVQMAQSIGSAIMAAGKAAIAPAAEMEAAQLRLSNLLGSEARAASLFAELVEFAAKTPFEMPGLMEATAQLLNAGVPAEALMEKLLQLGNVAAISGRRITDISQVYAKAFSFGTVSNEIAEQFTTAGLNLRKLLAEAQGVSAADIFKQISQKQITAADLDSVLAAYAGKDGKFGKAMESLSGTAKGLFGTLADGVEQALARLGQGFLPQVKKVTTWLANAAEKLQPIMEELGASIGRTLQVLGSEFAALGVDWKGLVQDATRLAAALFDIGARAVASWLRYEKVSGRLSLALGSLRVLVGALGVAFAGLARVVEGFYDLTSWVAGGIRSIGSAIGDFFSRTTAEQREYQKLVDEYAALTDAPESSADAGAKTAALRRQTAAQQESNAALQERLQLAEQMRAAFATADSRERESLIATFSPEEQKKAWLSLADLQSEAALQAELSTLRAAAAADRATQAQLDRQQLLLEVKQRIAAISRQQAEAEAKTAEEAKKQREEAARKQSEYARQREHDLAEQAARLLELQGDSAAAAAMRAEATERRRREELTAAGASEQEAAARAAFERRLAEAEASARDSLQPSQAQWLHTAISALGGGGGGVRFGGQEPALKEAQRQTSLLQESLQVLRNILEKPTTNSIPVVA